MNKQELIDKYTAEISRLRPYCPNRHLISEQLKYDLYKEILEDLKQLDEPQKPVVPKFVAEWIEYAKKKGDSLAISFKPWNLYGVEYSKVDRWIEDNQETFARAWLDGYEVEKEPLYEVIIGDLYLIKKFNNRNDFYFDTSCSLCAWEKSAYQLTEAEIKAIDERYWPFAVPVEEVAEG
ncbi:TPA: DUF1642 domain-containing protein [Enterococcus faecium]|uniref:DUF1642 domain-containing protein n=2 Tax=Enterococcus faecium TaxID=1352 RepID=UPI001C44E4E5|nr:DUF1642 domain-containing protein [Enterococcus faecium]MCD5061937.1 DUF1642 domain-containing protein [Enterococcus faecium]MCD5105836.1 DUF1642 domain-containing protein [Enterococcus faecium]QXJ50825.1 DUF1642 domain-containing protein [Enterococcus faecium]BDX41188.1 hypothetical protein K6D_12620 [Enterococcus faecium]HEM3777419.1 DUF1642 domain-containing protein [Enterococcus faecium]